MSRSLNLQVVPVNEVPSRSAIPQQDKGRPLLLVVDDERVVADTLAIILTRSGFSVLTAYDGETALEMATAIRPDLLLSDVMLGPGIDGTELAIAVAKRFPECKVLLFSGNAATADLLAKARESGYNFSLMTKPVHPSDMLARIAGSLGTKAASTAA